MFHFLASHGKRNSAVHTGDESVQEEKYNSIKPGSIKGPSSLSQIPCDKVKLLPENDVSSDTLSHSNKQIESTFIENKEKWSDGKTKFWKKEGANETECQTTKGGSALVVEKETFQINIFPNFREYFQELFEKVRKQVAHQSKLKFLRSKEMTKTENWKPAEEVVNIGVYMARKDDSLTTDKPDKREMNSQKNVGEETRKRVTKGKKSGRDIKDQHSKESEEKNKRVKEMSSKYHRSKKKKSSKKSKKKTRERDTDNSEASGKKNYPEDTEFGLLKKKTAKGKEKDPELMGRDFQGNTKDDQIPKKRTRPEQSQGLTTLTKNQKSEEDNPDKSSEKEIINWTERREARARGQNGNDLRDTSKERRGSPTYEKRIITVGPKINKQKSRNVEGLTHATAKKRGKENIQESHHKACNIPKKKGKEEDLDVSAREEKEDLINNPDGNEVMQENPGQKVKKTKDAVKFYISPTTTKHKDSLQPTANNSKGKKSNKAGRESIRCSSNEKECAGVNSSTQSKIENECNEGGNGTCIDCNQDKEQEEVEIKEKQKSETSVQKKKKRKWRNDVEKESKSFTGKDERQVEGKVTSTTSNNEWERTEILSMKKIKRIGSKNKKKAREPRQETHKQQEEMSCRIEEKSEAEPIQFGEVEETKIYHIKEDSVGKSKRKNNKNVMVTLNSGKQVDQEPCHSVKDAQKEKEMQCEVNKKSTKEIKRENTEFVDFGGGLNIIKVVRASKFHSRNATTPEDQEIDHGTDERFHDGEKTAIKRRFSVSLGTPNSAKKSRFLPIKSPAQSSFTRRHSWQPYISRCAICKTTDHTTNDPDCPAYDPHPAKRICFKGPLCCMSNMYPCKLIYQDLTFTSTEQAYQWQRAMDIERFEVARKILEAVDGFEAKRLSNELDKSRVVEWKEKNCIRVMTELIEAKFEQVERFRQVCIESRDAYLMEATFDTFWGVGLLEEAASNCKLEYLPGKNVLGWIIMQVRNKHVVGLNNHLRDIYQEKNTGHKEMSTFFQGIGHLFGNPFGRDHSVQKNLGRSSGNSPHQRIPPWKRRRSEQSSKTKFTSTLQSFSGQNFRRICPTPCIFGPENLISKSPIVNKVMDAPGQSDDDAVVTLQHRSLGINTIHPSPDIASADVTNFHPLAPSSTWSELMSPRRNDAITPSIDQTPTFIYEGRREDEINQIEPIVNRDSEMITTVFVKEGLVKDKVMTRKERKEPTIRILRLVEYDTCSSDQESDYCEDLKSLQESETEVVTVNDFQKVEPPRQMHVTNAESTGIHLSSDVSVGLVKLP